MSTFYHAPVGAFSPRWTKPYRWEIGPVGGTTFILASGEADTHAEAVADSERALARGRLGDGPLHAFVYTVAPEDAEDVITVPDTPSLRMRHTETIPRP